jgi:hypothetical protein
VCLILLDSRKMQSQIDILNTRVASAMEEKMTLPSPYAFNHCVCGTEKIPLEWGRHGNEAEEG